jgi:aspartyl-tRNA(Asn)/glutamyl-tRNA(Gln) amidotransferase subunit A
VTEPTDLTLTEIATRIRSGALSPVKLVEAYLARIEAIDPTLNSYRHVMREQAIAGAQAAERSSPAGILHGVPIALKDLFDVAGIPTTAGSAFSYTPDADAAIVARLREAGAIILGKLNMHEWAVGVTNINPHHGPVRNPWDTSRIPGGSSGGSGAAVAAGLCAGAMGSDTGGSVRIPCALCGLTGLRPTRGLLSLRGVVPMSWTLDTVGPMLHTAEDLALMLQVLAGYDPADPVSVRREADDYLAALNDGLAGIRIGLPRGHFFEGLEPPVENAVLAAVDTLANAGAEVRDVDLPGAEEAWANARLISLVDTVAYHRERLAESPERFGEDVRQRLEAAREHSGVDYALARQGGRLWVHRVARVLEEVDVLLTPTVPVIAPALEGRDNIAAVATLTAFTYPFSLTGMPALSVLCGFSEEGLPVGMQLAGPPFSEARLLRLAHAYQRLTDWHIRRPEV